MGFLEDGRRLPFARALASALRDIRPRPVALMVLASLPVLAAAWALMSPTQILSNVEAWDFVFNLAGAWHVYLGQVPHVDFYGPVGRLNFELTAIGFHLVGLSPFAFFVGVALVVGALFVAAVLAALPRLPMLMAALFVVMICLLALMPFNPGEKIDQYSFAMSYNRYCWAAFSILGLILFVPQRNRLGRDWVDIVVGGLLMLAMFYLKITYFAAGVAAVLFAVLAEPHVGRRRLLWLAVCVFLIANALLPHSWPYLADVLASAQSGAVRGSLTLHLKNFFGAIGEYAPYIAAQVLAFWMAWTGRASLRLPLVIAFLFAIALLLLSQNTQRAGLPSTVVIVLVLYDRLREQMANADGRDAGPLLLSLLVFPALAISASAFVIAGYHAKASRASALYVVTDTNLRGLAVPADQRGAFASFSRGRIDHPLTNERGDLVPRYEISQYEYVFMLVEAARLLAPREPGGIAVFDQVNPLSFMLGWPPARGANLWSVWDSPTKADDEYLADVRYVLVPKFSSDINWTAHLVERHQRYLADHYRQAEHLPNWRLFVRVSHVSSGRE